MDTLYSALADKIRKHIDSGQLKPGDRLRGVRTQSEKQSVSIATVLAAYHALEDQGYIESRPRSGFYVALKKNTPIAVPDVSAPASVPVPVSGQEMALWLVKAANNPAIVQLGAAVPDASFLPTVALEKANLYAARQRLNSANYEFPPGLPELRTQISRRMAATGCTTGANEIVITSGCQEALTLALRAVTVPGDVVALESPTFYGLLQVVESLGLKALEIPTHPEQGISIEALQLALEQWPVKACVVVPNFSNPLGYCMTDMDKQRLVKLVEQHNIPLIEDDVCGDLGFTLKHAAEGQGPRPIALKSLERSSPIIYCSSFSKTLSPGLRIGWIAPGKYLERIEYLKYVSNLASATLPQLAISHFLKSGQYERHLKHVTALYAQGVARMIDTLSKQFPADCKITQPKGGFVLWIELPQQIDTFKLAQQCLQQGISIAPGQLFSANKKYRNFMRLSCASAWNEPLERAISKLAGLIHQNL